MLLFMIVCAAGAVLLFALGGFDDLRDAWSHPEQKDIEDLPHHPSELKIEAARAFRRRDEHYHTDENRGHRVV
jgi:hypothetical protein